MSKKLVAICEGVLLVVIGVLVAVFGGGQTMDLIFGIIGIAGGAAMLCLAILALIKEKKYAFNLWFVAVAGLLIGIFLVAEKTTIAFLIEYAIYFGIAFGAAFLGFGIYNLVAKKDVKAGLIQLLGGALIVTFGMLFLFVPDFAQFFWIVVGVLIALAGVYVAVMALLKKEAK